MRCRQCNVDYPAWLLAPMGTSRIYFDKLMCCGICYLFLSNRILGLERTHLDGKDAEALRLKAIRWRNHNKPYIHNPLEEFKKIRIELISFWGLELGTEGYEILQRSQKYLWDMYGENP